jgi:dTDP-glucose pyrophosphorylase
LLGASVDAFAAGPSPSGELEIADVIRKAIDDGLRVEGRIVSSRPFLDVGTPEGLRKALGDRAAPGPDD